MLRLRPISLRDANEYVRQHHRHHKPVAGHKFSIGCEADGELVGVIIAGRPVSRYTRQDKLEADVLAAIQLQVKAALNYDKLLAKLRNSEGERSIRDQQNALITSLNLKLSGISKKRTRLYEDFTEGILDEEEYAFAKKAYDEQYVDLSRRLDEAVQRKVKFAEAMSEDNKWLTLMKSVSGATMLSQELVDESVELVKVHEDGSIELVMKYGDIYALTVQSIKEVQEAM